nr:DUF2225 domain-containing protein [Clostridium butyricum]
MDLGNAYQNEPFPIYGLQRDSLTYVVGDLNRRTGNDAEVLLWLSKTIVYTNASP